MLLDIASIVFACVTANHLGLIKAVEGTIGYKLPILNCPKCSTFWVTLTYSVTTCEEATKMFAISFLASYMAIWFELFEGYIDTLYNKIYDKIYSATDRADDGT